MDSAASGEHMAQDDFKEKTIKINRTVDKSVSNSFRKLSSPSHQDRLKAATTIVKYLFSKQIDQRGELCHELSHVLHRLIRGVGTPREDARIGFYATLVSLLATFPEITIPKVLEVINKELVGGGAMTKSEQAEEFTGQVLTYGAVIQSGALNLASPDDQQAVLTNLTTIAGKRDYLPPFAYSFLIQFLETVRKRAFRETVWPVVSALVARPWSQQTHDTLHLLLVLTERHPSLLDSDFYVRNLEADLVDETAIRQCCQLLMAPPKRLLLAHPVYAAFVSRLSALGQLSALGRAIDKQLRERGGAAAELASAHFVTLAATHCADKTQVAALMEMEVLMLLLRRGSQRQGGQRQGGQRQGAAADGNVFRAALEALVAAMKGAADETVVPLIQRLLAAAKQDSQAGNGFRVAKQLVSTLSQPGVLRLLELHAAAMTGSKGSKASKESKPPGDGVRDRDRVMSAQAFAHLLAHPALQADQPRRADAAMKLFALGFFADADLSQAAAAQMKTCFLKTLDQRTPSLEALRTFLGGVVSAVDSALNPPASAVLRQPLSAQAATEWKRMLGTVHRLGRGKKAAAIPAAAVFHTMFLHLGLLLLNDTDTAIDALQELHSCFARVESDRGKGKGSDAGAGRLVEGLLEEGEPAWADVAVELLLSLLGNPSHLLRRLVLCVFPHLAAHVTPSALHQILSVLDTKTDRAVLRGADESESESEEEGADEEEEEEEEEEEMEEDEEEEDDDDGDVFAEEREPVNEKLKVALRQALWPSGAALPASDDEDEDLEIDEEEGKKLNIALANAFREFRASRPGAKKGGKQPAEEEALMHFRARVLDLLELALATSPSMSTCLDAMPVLLQLLQFAVRDPHQKPLENRTRVCVRKLASVKSWRDVADVTPARVAALLHSVLDKADRTAPLYLDMLGEITALSTFLVRCSQRLESTESTESTEAADGEEDGVTARFLQALQDFMTRRDCLHSVGLYKSVLALPWRGNFALAAALADAAFAPVRTFRKLQALALLADFLRNKQLAQPVEPDLLARRRDVVLRIVQGSTQLFAREASSTETPLKARLVTELLRLLRLAEKQRQDGACAKRWRKLAVALAAFAHATGARGHGVLAAVRALCAKLNVELDNSLIQAACKPAGQPKPSNGTAVDGDVDDGESLDEAADTKHKPGKLANGAAAAAEDDDDEKTAKKQRKADRRTKREREGAEGGGEKRSKKASRELREAAMSQGFASGVFGLGLPEHADGSSDDADADVGQTNGKNKKSKKGKKKRKLVEEESAREHKRKKTKSKT